MPLTILTDLNDPKNWPLLYWPSEGECELIQPYDIRIAYNCKTYSIRIPIGVKFDGLTGRKIASIIQIEPGRSDPAWLVHDWLYIRQGEPFHLTRKDVDTIFKNMLVDLGYGERRPFLAYLAVRLRGGRYWKT